MIVTERDKSGARTLEIDAAERNVTMADVCDDAHDPEAPDAWHMDDDGVDAFAAEFAEFQRQSITAKTLRALDRAAGGAR